MNLGELSCIIILIRIPQFGSMVSCKRVLREIQGGCNLFGIIHRHCIAFLV